VLLVRLLDLLGDRRLAETADEGVLEPRRAAALTPEAARADRPNPGADDLIRHSACLDRPVDKR
jgi:hypothetical protein